MDDKNEKEKEKEKQQRFYEKELDELKTLNYKLNDLNHSFSKHLILVASGSLSIIISFHKTSSSPCSTDIYFLTLFLIALGIVTLAISLYSDISTYRLAANLNWIYLQKRYWNGDKTAVPHTGQKPKIYIWCEKIGFSALLLAVVSFLVLAKLEA
jgi:hypothetical protein